MVAMVAEDRCSVADTEAEDTEAHTVEPMVADTATAMDAMDAAAARTEGMVDEWSAADTEAATDMATEEEGAVEVEATVVAATVEEEKVVEETVAVMAVVEKEEVVKVEAEIATSSPSSRSRRCPRASRRRSRS